MKLSVQQRHLLFKLVIILLVLPGAQLLHAKESKPRPRQFLILTPAAVDLTGEGVQADHVSLGAEFARSLAETIGKSARVAESSEPGFPKDSFDFEAAESFALVQGADASVSGYYVLEVNTDGAVFARIVLNVTDLSRRESRFSLSYQGKVSAGALESSAARLASRAAETILARIQPLDTQAAEQLEAAAQSAGREKLARSTITITVLSAADPETSVSLPDGSSAGTMAEGKVVITVPTGTLFRLTLEREGYYPRTVERFTGDSDITIEVPRLYPERKRDTGVTVSYLRPFGLLGEWRLRMFAETVTLGTSAGLFLLPDYLPDEVFHPDFSNLLVETEAGAHFGWYMFSRADAGLRFQLELNTRFNTYTNPNLQWHTFLAVMSGFGLRMEVNRPGWFTYLGIRGYYPMVTPANVAESGIVLLNGGVAWKK